MVVEVLVVVVREGQPTCPVATIGNNEPAGTDVNTSDILKVPEPIVTLSFKANCPVK